MANKSIIDMAKDFLAIVRKSRVGTVQPYDMAVILNQATEAVVTDKLKVIEIDKKSYNDLLPLRTTTIIEVTTIKATTIDATTSDAGDLFPNKMFAVPSNFRRDIRLTAKFGTNAPTKTILIKSNEATDILNGVFSRPTIHQTYYMYFLNGNTPSIKIYTGSITDDVKAQFEYYRNPVIITENMIVEGSTLSEFNNEVSMEIIEKAALMYLERVQDARVNTFNNITNK